MYVNISSVSPHTSWLSDTPELAVNWNWRTGSNWVTKPFGSVFSLDEKEMSCKSRYSSKEVLDNLMNRGIKTSPPEFLPQQSQLPAEKYHLSRTSTAPGEEPPILTLRSTFHTTQLKGWAFCCKCDGGFSYHSSLKVKKGKIQCASVNLQTCRKKYPGIFGRIKTFDALWDRFMGKNKTEQKTTNQPHHNNKQRKKHRHWHCETEWA